MTGEMRNDDELFEFQPHRDYLYAELCKIVFISVADFSDETVYMESFDGTRDLSTSLSFEFAPQMLVLKAADGELWACYGLEQELVVITKEIEAFVGTIMVDHCSGDLIQFFRPGTWVINGRDKLDVSAIGCDKKFGKGWKGVDSFLHLSEFL